MKITKQDIKALKKLREICQNIGENCLKCPFCIDKECIVQDIPNYWWNLEKLENNEVVE